jgi:hypothetical protein
MSALWPVLAIILFVWLMTRESRARPRTRTGPDPRDEAIARLTRRVNALEEIITDRDWRLRRDFDGL